MAFLGVSIGLGIVLIGFFVLQRQRAARPELTQQEIEQHALTIAQSEYQGVVTKLNVQRFTFAHFGALNCSWSQRLVQAIDKHPWNGCEPNTPFWRVQLEGKFRWNKWDVTNLRFDILTDGTVMAKWTESNGL